MVAKGPKDMNGREVGVDNLVLVRESMATHQEISPENQGKSHVCFGGGLIKDVGQCLKRIGRILFIESILGYH